MPLIGFMSVSNAFDALQDQLSPTALEAVRGVANLWPNVKGKQTHECRKAVCRCLTLGISQGDLAFYIRGSVYASVPFMTVNKSDDQLYPRIYARIANIAKADNASTAPKIQLEKQPTRARCQNARGRPRPSMMLTFVPNMSLRGSL
jgi:hypothetical protein